MLYWIELLLGLFPAFSWHGYIKIVLQDDLFHSGGVPSVGRLTDVNKVGIDLDDVVLT